MLQLNTQTMFWFLLGVQILSAHVIFLIGLPIYRKLLNHQRDQATLSELALIVGTIAVMQAAYWAAYPLQRRLTFRRWVLLGHLFVGLGDLSFLFPTTMAAVAVFDQSLNLQTEWWRLLILVVGLFAMFCYKCQLQSLGSAWTEAKA